MMQKKYNVLFMFMLVSTSVFADSIGNALDSIVSQYEIALQDLIEVHQSMQPPVPIQLNESSLIGATYNKIIRPYVLEIQGYSNVVFSAYSRKYPYYSDLQVLQKKFTEYEQKIVALSKKFPEEIQQDVLNAFYYQLTDTLVQNCTKILQNAAYTLDTDQQSLDIAFIAYSLAWAAQTPAMKIVGFSDIATFKTNITTWIVSIYQAAIAHLTTQLQKTNNKEVVYNQIISCYQNLTTIYTNSGNVQKAAVENQNIVQMQAQKKQFAQVVAMIASADQSANAGRVKIQVDFLQPEETMQNIQGLLSDISTAYKAYKAALVIYTTLQDSSGAQLCQAQINQLQGDFAIRKIQLLWLSFAKNAYLPSVASNVEGFAEMQKFYTLDPSKDSVSVSKIQEALTDLLNLCTKAPNSFDANLWMTSLAQSAATFYQAAIVGHPSSSSEISLIDSKTLQGLQQSLQNFIGVLQGMIAIGQGQEMISGSNVLAQVMVQAQNIDRAFSQDPLLKSFFFYFPDLEMSEISQKSFQSFVVQYVYRIALTKVQAYIKPSSAQQPQNEQAMMLALSDLITLQAYKNYITETQSQNLQKAIIALAQAMNIEQYAQKVYKQAQKSNAWINTALSGNGYQSVTDSLWNVAINLCEIGIDLSMLPNVATAAKVSTAELQEIYMLILQDYIKAFIANTPKPVGYQLHIFVALYKLYIVSHELSTSQAAFLKKNDVSSFVQQKLSQLFGGANGFFAQAKQAVNGLSVANISAQQKSTKEHEIAQLMNQINVVVEQQTLAMSKLAQLLSMSTEPDALLESVTDNVTITVTMKIASNSYMVQITNPIAVKINRLTDQITADQTAGEQAESKQDFVSAATWYEKVKSDCLTLLPLLNSSDLITQYRDIYFLATTRYTASFLANQVVIEGTTSLNSLKNIPKDYYAQSYQLNNVDMQLLSGSVPQSLQSLTTLTTLSKTQMQDAISVFKAYIISQLLLPQGLTFSTCYTGYGLQKQAGLSKENKKILAENEAFVSAYLKKWNQPKGSAMVAGTNISFVFEKLPIPPVAPLYTSAPDVASYFVGAAELFKPGTELVDGGQYVPGQDQASYQLMLANIAYAYVVAAQRQLNTVQAIAGLLTADLKKSVKAKKTMPESDFMKKYNKIKEGFVGAQSLLFAENGSAYYYFGMAQQAENAQIVKKIFLNLYQQQVTVLSGLLIGNPVSDAYSAVLSDLNQAYLSWSVELDPTADATQINKNKAAVVQLFQTAGTACMNYAYTQTMFPNLQQYHYMTAASNYEAAKQQSVSMLNNSQQALAMRSKALQAYFFACSQKMAAYYYAKQKGLVYIPATMIGDGATASVQPIQISFSDLLTSYQDFENGGNPNQGEIDAYNEVQKLLLDAAMYFDYLAGVYEKNVTPTTPKSSQKAAKASLDPQLLSYLQSQGIISSQDDSISFVDSDILAKLFNLADSVFVKFQSNTQALADWCNTLYTAIQYQYIDDYQGGINQTLSPSDQASEFTKKWQSFSIAMQKESSALENPSSAYIG